MYSSQAALSLQGSAAAGGPLEGPDRIFVDGMPYYFTEAQFKEVLESFGLLSSFELVKDRETGNSKAAFCVYQDVSVTDIACLALNGIQMGDRTLIVRRANHDEFAHSSSQKNCGICWSSLTTGQGQAIFTAECSHYFHYPCIANNVQHGNLSCPVCRAKWNKNNVPFQVPPPQQANFLRFPPVPLPTQLLPHLIYPHLPTQQFPHWNYPQYPTQLLPHWNYPQYPFEKQPQNPREPLTFSDDEPLQSSTSPAQSSTHQNVTVKTHTESSV